MFAESNDSFAKKEEQTTPLELFREAETQLCL